MTLATFIHGHHDEIIHAFEEFAGTMMRAPRHRDRSVAMSIVGHKTESIYRRYAIVDEAMQREAAARLDPWVQAPRPTARTATVKSLRKTSR